MCISAVMMLSSLGLGGCNSKSDTSETSDEKWFQVKKVDASEYYEGVNFPSADGGTELVGSYGDVIVVMTIMIPQEYDPDALYQDSEAWFLDFYSKEGDYIKTIHINDYLDYDDISVFATAKVDSNGIKIMLNGYDVKTNAECNYVMPIDPDTLEPGEIVPAEEGRDPYANRYPGAYLADTISDCGVTIYSYCKGASSPSEKTSYILLIVDEDGNETEIDLGKQFPDCNIWDIPAHITISEDKILLLPFMDDGAFKLLLDLNDMTISEAGTEYDWIDEDAFLGMGITNIEGQGSFVVDSMDSYLGGNSCLKRINVEEQRMETVIDFSHVLINQMDMNGMKLIDIHDGEYIFAGYSYNGSFAVLTLTELEGNPFEGKTELKAASLTEYDYGILESIYRFNATNEDYYITVDHRYDLGNYESDDNNATTMDDYNDSRRSREAEISDQLMVDLMAGDGPDILFNASSLTAINRPDYLVDLSDRIDDESTYFTNVLDAVRTGDAIYQMPVSFIPNGIVTFDQYVDEGQEGFTFDQYERFVDEICNGNDPMSDYTTQKTYFSELFNSCSDLFISNGTADFNNDGFRDLVSFIKDHVKNTDNSLPEYDGATVEYYYDYGNGTANNTLPEGKYKMLDDFGFFLENYRECLEDVRFLGAPSPDGRGPSFMVGTSIAISAASDDPEGCNQFLDMFLDSDMASVIVYGMDTASSSGSVVTGAHTFSVTVGSTSIPVNKLALDSYMQNALDNYNSKVEYYKNIFTEDELRMYGLPTTSLSDDCLDIYREFVSSCDHVYTEDPYVAVILSEELQAYYEDQKTLDTVIDTLTNRVNTYLSERG